MLSKDGSALVSVFTCTAIKVGIRFIWFCWLLWLLSSIGSSEIHRVVCVCVYMQWELLCVWYVYHNTTIFTLKSSKKTMFCWTFLFKFNVVILFIQHAFELSFLKLDVVVVLSGNFWLEITATRGGGGSCCCCCLISSSYHLTSIGSCKI